MEVLLLAVMATANIVCFVVGAKVGQTVSKGDPVKLPSVNPMEAYKEHKAKKELQRTESRKATIMANIDNYNGTAEGQKDVP